MQSVTIVYKGDVHLSTDSQISISLSHFLLKVLSMFILYQALLNVPESTKRIFFII